MFHTALVSGSGEELENAININFETFEAVCYFQYWSSQSRIIETDQGVIVANEPIAVVLMETGEIKSVSVDLLRIEGTLF